MCRLVGNNTLTEWALAVAPLPVGNSPKLA